MKIKRYLFTLFLLFLLIAAQCVAGTITANSPSYSDVSAAVSSASDGDTVAIPAGTAAWSSVLTINKAITLRGAGTSYTTIQQNNTNGQRIIDVSAPAGKVTRITGIYFDLMNYTVGPNNHRGVIWMYGIAGKIRVDHCYFIKGQTQVWVKDAYGVIDHNTFHNAEIAIRLAGAGTDSWNRPIIPGTADTMFVEDNTFLMDSGFGARTEEQIYHDGRGERGTFRYNFFDGRNFNDSYLPFEAHGNQALYGSTYGDFYRGMVMNEVYNNTVNCKTTYRMFYFRAGSILFFNNTITCDYSSPSIIQLTDEESWQTAFFNPLDTTWPAQDQINNSFFWNNTFNGNPVTGINYNNSKDATFIQEGRDYWMHEPQATGGRTVYTSWPGGNMTFNSSGPNAYYPYTPYTYPHPLVTGEPPPPTDTTPPTDIATVNDGTDPGGDIDYTYSTTQLSANWSESSDPESNISGYKYAIGTSQGSANTTGWTSNAGTSVVKTGLTLTIGTTYYFSVKAVNGISLQSPSATNSDGQCVCTATVNPPEIPEKVKVWPNPFTPKPGSLMKFTSLRPKSVLKIYTLSGKLVRSLTENGGDAIWNGKNIDGQSISSGLYIYVITDGVGNRKTGKFVITK